MPRPRTTEEQKREAARLRKQKQRSRERSARRPWHALEDSTHDIIKGDFAEYLRSHYDDTFEQGLHAGGIIFTGDLLNEDHREVYPEGVAWESDFNVPLNSLNRTIVMIGGMLDAARELATMVNRFKIKEIDLVLAEADSASLSMAEIEKLYRLKGRLRRSIQVRLPVYHVGGG